MGELPSFCHFGLGSFGVAGDALDGAGKDGGRRGRRQGRRTSGATARTADGLLPRWIGRGRWSSSWLAAARTPLCLENEAM
jgi:hypothetical protein